MIILFSALFIIDVSVSEMAKELQGVTPLAHISELNTGPFSDAEHRGPRFYNYDSTSDSGSNIDSDSEEEYSLSSSAYSSEEDEGSNSASSFETSEKKMRTRTYRKCKPCPTDMMKRHDNLGIKWICGGYQRARRSFKSTCMMKYRNCEDGTMFVMLYRSRCKDDEYHGKHWFYIYRV